MRLKPIILLGGGGHCKSAIDVIEAEGKFEIIGILDLPEKKGNYVLNYEIIGSDDTIDSFITSCKYFLVTLGQIKRAKPRIDLYTKIKKAGGVLPNIISPNAYIGKNVIVGEGNIIMHSAIINTGAEIGNNCIINNMALIEHDTTIGNHVHISTGANINGNCRIGNGCFIGSGSTTIEGILIEDNVTIGAGSVIVNDIEKNKTVFGNPGIER